jgi:hypothetical protein
MARPICSCTSCKISSFTHHSMNVHHNANNPSGILKHGCVFAHEWSIPHQNQDLYKSKAYTKNCEHCYARHAQSYPTTCYRRDDASANIWKMYEEDRNCHEQTHQQRTQTDCVQNVQIRDYSYLSAKQILTQLDKVTYTQGILTVTHIVRAASSCT